MNSNINIPKCLKKPKSKFNQSNNSNTNLTHTISHNNSKIINNSYKGRKPTSFSFKGEAFHVKSWDDILIKLIGISYKKCNIAFNGVFDLKGRKRPYFSYNYRL
ncbi:hypothetical protein [Methanobrevibacter filiformis]|uniref:Uncharacterized protein n=1 Tax=Methanobrevibacter filiformis TaxID=55758 RepID=A0A162FCM3_9EURY|nr:hypothetical protein [Methanobrevibacter filiformis]KZX11045.1 hypothetical protein MBFIL_15460 [Methanobrevibacter filiformis]